MRISGMGMDTPTYNVAMSAVSPDGKFAGEDVICDASVRIQAAHIDFATAKDKHRPYLSLSGIVDSIHGNFPRNIEEITFERDIDKPRVDYVYNFSNVELSHLAALGMYDKGFQMPELFYTATFQLPVKLDYMCVTDKAIPLMFVKINQQYNNEIDGASSGYAYEDEQGSSIGLAQYFEPINKEEYDKFIESIAQDYLDENELKRTGMLGYEEEQHVEDILKRTSSNTEENHENS